MIAHQLQNCWHWGCEGHRYQFINWEFCQLQLWGAGCMEHWLSRNAKCWQCFGYQNRWPCGVVRIWFPFTYIHPFIKFPKHFRILWMTVYNDTTNILELYLLLQNTLSQSRATEPPGTVASLSSNSLSKSGNTLFETRSQRVLAATRFLARGRGPQRPRITSCESTTLTGSHTKF